MNPQNESPEIKQIRSDIASKERVLAQCASSKGAAEMVERELQQLHAKLIRLQVNGGHEIETRC